MFETIHNIDGGYFEFESEKPRGIVNYMMWSDVFICPYCKNEYVFFDTAVDIDEGKVRDRYHCPYCSASITKRESEKPFENKYDTSLDIKVSQQKQIPILINYTFDNKKFVKKVDDTDLQLVNKIEEMTIPYWHPINKILTGDKTSELINRGFINVHHLYSKRNLWVLASFYDKIPEEYNRLKFIVTKVASQVTKMYRYTYQSGTWGAGHGFLIKMY